MPSGSPEQMEPGDKRRQASCACGKLSVTVQGDPYNVFVCSCTQCQRRTGSAFGLSAYFHGPQIVELSGAETRYIRSSDSGRPVQFHFCPSCGTTLYWTGIDEPISAGIGIAGGCFADKHFPGPQLVAWNQNQLHWLEFPGDIPTMATQPDALDIFD
jgi:hypothetical protein